MSIRDLLRALRRNLVIVLVCVVAGLAGGAVLAFTQPSSYTTQIRLFVSSNGSDSTDSLLQNSNLVLNRVPSYVTLVNSPLVLGQVAQKLGRTESVEQLAAKITATNPLQTALIEITVNDTTARKAYDLAVGLAETVTAVVQRIETSSTGFVPVKVTVVSQPELPSRPDLAGPAWRIALGLLLGLVLGGVIAIGRELLDSRLKDPEQLRTKLGLPPLAVIATGAKGGTVPAPLDDEYWTSPASEGYRQLRTNLRVLVASGGLRSILVTGPTAADGGSAVAQNLAVALGLAQVRVLLVEADMRNPRYAAAFGIEHDEHGGVNGGLAAVLAGETGVDTVIHPWRDGALHVLPAGALRPSSGELLASDAMEDLFARLERRFDLLVISAPPLLEVADASVLATRADGVVLTARYRGTRWDAVWRSLQSLHDVQARVLGAAVLCKTRIPGAAPRDALRVPMSASRWAGGPGAVPAPRSYDASNRGSAAGGVARRSLRPVPDLPKQQRLEPGHPPEPPPITPARGVAAVGDGNRVEPGSVPDPAEQKDRRQA